MSSMMMDANVAGVTWEDMLESRSARGAQFGRPITDGEISEMAGDVQGVLTEFAQKNGIDITDDFIANAQRNVLEGGATIDDIVSGLRKNVLDVLYPGFKDEFDAGLTVEDIASPYIQTASSILEDPFIDANDSVVQMALQGAEGQRMPIWEYKNQLKDDPRWQYTDNAYEEISSAMEGAMREMGL